MPTPTRFRVDLEALHSNLAAARDLAGGRKVLAAVKANAYGHGLVPVARAIQEQLLVEVDIEQRQLAVPGVALVVRAQLIGLGRFGIELVVGRLGQLCVLLGPEGLAGIGEHRPVAVDAVEHRQRGQ